MDDPVLLPLTHARRFAWPVPDLWTCSSLSEADLRAYYRFRRQFMDLKPHVDPEKDWTYFASWVKRANFCWLSRDGAGHLQGVITLKVESRVHEGKPVSLVWPEYGYSLPSARKSTGLRTATLTAIGQGVLQNPRAPLYVVGAGYVSSSLALAQVFDSIWFQEDSAMSPWERSLWQSLAGSTSGFDPTTKVVSLGTVPRNPRRTPPSEPRLYEVWHRYVTQSPNWFEGHVCFLMGRLEMAMAANTLRWFTQKMLRTR